MTAAAVVVANANAEKPATSGNVNFMLAMTANVVPTVAGACAESVTAGRIAMTESALITLAMAWNVAMTAVMGPAAFAKD